MPSHIHRELCRYAQVSTECEEQRWKRRTSEVKEDFDVLDSADQRENCASFNALLASSPSFVAQRLGATRTRAAASGPCEKVWRDDRHLLDLNDAYVISSKTTPDQHIETW